MSSKKITVSITLSFLWNQHFSDDRIICLIISIMPIIDNSKFCYRKCGKEIDGVNSKFCSSSSFSSILRYMYLFMWFFFLFHFSLRKCTCAMYRDDQITYEMHQKSGWVCVFDLLQPNQKWQLINNNIKCIGLKGIEKEIKKQKWIMP